ncbi:MAG: ATP synthase F1 subunit gamma [Lachnospiraceae bacterium]|nr:ATP synthase F1 subunit gamma [Lachnospiraceae bacterium]
MASMRSIKSRRNSIQSTQQITKAMKLVSTVKLQRAKTRAEQSKAYFTCMYETIRSMLAKTGEIQHPYVQGNDSKKKAVIVITSNRGLAGGYNSNIIKLITKTEMMQEDLKIYTIGKKGREGLSKYSFEMAEDYSDLIEDPTYVEAMQVANTVLKEYENGEVGEIYLAYTAFKNTVSHIPTMLKLLPVEAGDEKKQEKAAQAPMGFEQDESEVLALLIPKYVTSLIFGGMVEAVASENGARMQAMDSATSNAEEMIDKLSLQYNRARQGSITQELTEIIAGASAIS